MATLRLLQLPLPNSNSNTCRYFHSLSFSSFKHRRLASSPCSSFPKNKPTGILGVTHVMPDIIIDPTKGDGHKRVHLGIIHRPPPPPPPVSSVRQDQNHQPWTNAGAGSKRAKWQEEMLHGRWTVSSAD